MSISKKVLSLISFLLVLVSGTAMAAPGDLDTSFAGDGVATDDFAGLNDRAHAVAVDSLGRVIVGGCAKTQSGYDDFALIRYTSDGQIDLAFGSGGKILTDFGNSNYVSDDCVYALAVQSDDKIVAVGSADIAYSGNYFAVARYNTDGTLDSSFSSDGKVLENFFSSDTISSTTEDTAKAVLIQSDGKILVGGSGSTGSNQDFGLARFNADGSLDTTFAGDGRKTTDFNSSPSDEIETMILLSNGQILAGGKSDNGSKGKDFALARYNSDGSLDKTFSGNGKVRIDFSNTDDSATTLIARSDGKYDVAGCAGDDVGTVRLTSSGVQDGSTATTPFDDCKTTLPMKDGSKVMAAGVATNGSDEDFVVGRVEPSGGMDASFGTNGMEACGLMFGRDENPAAIAVQSDGKVVAAGWVKMGTSNKDFAVARYDGGGSSTVHAMYMTTTPVAKLVSADQTDLAVNIQVTTLVEAGKTFGFHTFVMNEGPADASNVVLTLTLPTDAIQANTLTVTTGAGTCSGDGPVTCNLGSIAANTSLDIVTIFDIKNNFSGYLAVSAEVTSPSETNPTTFNNNMTITVPVP